MASNSVKNREGCSCKGLPVVFSCDAHIPGLDRELELWGEHGIVGSDAAQPLADFDVQESDFVISKRRYDGFYQTDLDLTLRELGVRHAYCCWLRHEYLRAADACRRVFPRV